MQELKQKMAELVELFHTGKATEQQRAEVVRLIHNYCVRQPERGSPEAKHKRRRDTALRKIERELLRYDLEGRHGTGAIERAIFQFNLGEDRRGL